MAVNKEEPKKETDGGSEIEVETQTVEVAKDANGGEEAGKETPKVQEGEAGLVGEALVETVVRVLGKTLALVTKIPEMDFDESETEQLKKLWSPFVPNMSPTVMAVLGTVAIAGGKIGTYYAKKPKKITQVKATDSKEVEKEAKTIERELEEEWQGS